MRLVFLDIDGTYLAGSEVPQSASDAVRAARENGHRVFLCTGRSMAQLYPDILEAGFDGIIASGGGMITIGEQILATHLFSREQLARAVEWLDKHGVAYWLETDTGLVGSANLAERLNALPSQPYLRNPMPAIAGADRDDVRKLVFVGSRVPVDDVRAAFAGSLDVIAGTIPAMGSEMGELALPGIHKASAIEVVLDHYGLGREDTIAFGDGMNDLEMLEYVAVGVAMGDSADAVKAVADLVVTSAAEGGIAEGFARLGLV